jgi:hypothetical protein
MRLSARYGNRVLSTGETAADLVADRSVPDVARSTTYAQR